VVRKQISITLPENCLKWLNKKVESRLYDTNAHAIEVLILNEMKREGLVKDE
jgi:Arc/MetJ-type ribon-helix-helix transcriptional regulator